MDKSELFIKQCDCPEVQGQWKPDLHDYVIRRNKNHTLVQPTIIYYKSYYIWLPYQHQIQEMIGYHKDSSLLIYNFFNFCFKESITNVIEGGSPFVFQFPISTSREQLWLAFYFFEKHSKTWDSKKEKWVKK